MVKGNAEIGNRLHQNWLTLCFHNWHLAQKRKLWFSFCIPQVSETQKGRDTS